MDEITTLFRPVGEKELELIRESGLVLNEEYAAQIARNWNAKHEPVGVGYVTRFPVRTEYLKRHEVQTVGGSVHQEYWIPAEELSEFNQNIVGPIEVIAEFRNE